MNSSSSSKLSFSLFVILFLFSNLLVNGQGIQGVVSDLTGATIPNATLIIEEINTGTSSNLDGEYKYNLPKGTYTVRYEAMGFKSERKTIVINDTYEVVNVQLSEQVYQLKEVDVVKGEDPAYDIMRKAIASAPFHLNQVKKYSSDIYLRGTLEFKTIPWLLRNQLKVNDIPVKAGDAFSYESVNEIDFQAPDQYQHRVISEHSTFPETEGNPMPNFQGSFYQPEMGGIISPFSPNAFAYYRFIYEGYSLQDKVNICKIRVIPRRSGINVYDGVIYLVEGCWALHSLDLKNENTYFTATVKFISNPIAEDAWLPISYNFNMSGSILGISGQFDYNGAVKYKSVELNTSLQRPSFIKPFVESNSTVQTEMPVKKTRNQQIIEEISKKEELSNRDAIRLARILAKEAKSDTLKKSESLEIKENTTFTKDKDARDRDSLYWNAIRPIPLTQVEKKILQPDTSLVIKTASGKDSIPKKANPIMKALGNAVFGHSIKVGNDSSLALGYRGLLGLKQLDYNTVDGFVWGQSVYAHWQMDSIHLLKIEPSASYAFSREALMWEINSNYTYSPLRRGFVEFTLGHSSVDYNQTNGIRSIINAGYTLLGRQNFMKLYDDRFYSISNKIDLANGLESLVKLSYSSKNTLDNTTDFSFFYEDAREFTPNTPNNIDFVPFGIDGYKSATAELALFYTPFQHYRISKTGLKMVDYSKFPTFVARFKKGFDDVALSNSNFNLLEGFIWQHIDMVGSQSINYMMNGGGFINSKALSFVDFKHFNTQNIEFNLGSFYETFNLLDYYTYSSSKYYFQTHIKYETPYLLLKRLPFFDKQIWTESLRANYLTNEHIKNYCEVGYSVNNIFLMGNLGVFAGFEQGKYKSVGFQDSG